MTGANDRTLQTLMGHQSPRMILRYAHLSQTHLREALEKLVDFSPKETATNCNTPQKEVQVQDFTILTPLFHDVDPSSIKTHQIP